MAAADSQVADQLYTVCLLQCADVQGEETLHEGATEAERKAWELKHKGKRAANDAANTAEDAKEEGKGIFGGLFHKVWISCILVPCVRILTHYLIAVFSRIDSSGCYCDQSWSPL